VHGLGTALTHGFNNPIHDQITFKRGRRTDPNGFVCLADMQCIPIRIRIDRYRA
jgi:hypothetical protein